MNILLLYPRNPDSFWSFKNVLSFISRKAVAPPLGLITVSAMLPSSWHKKLVDLNVSSLNPEDILWADYVFVSAMYIQKESVDMIIDQCKLYNTKIVAGGPLFTQEYDIYRQIDHFILNEAEITLPMFLNDLDKGKTPERIYQTEEFADISSTPTPDYHLLSWKDYGYMSLQVSRGCPFSCEFCEVTSLLGHKVRIKQPEQILQELEALFNLGWRGPVSVVDDNFIGNKKEIKYKLLPAMQEWMQAHNYPFNFTIQTSINLADDQELMDKLALTGFNSAFIGIETPDIQSLQECHKYQNKNRDLLESVKKIQHSGLQVSGGFIIGFDSDTAHIFQRQIDFIQQSGIVTAMVGMLNAPKNTRLYDRLKAENRLTVDATGNNTDYSMNFIPKMDFDELMRGYKMVIENIYTEKPFYKRIRRFLMNYRSVGKKPGKIKLTHIAAFLKSILIIGLLNKGRREYWKFFFWTLFNRPVLFMEAMTYVVYGYHFRMVYGLKNGRTNI